MVERIVRSGRHQHGRVVGPADRQHALPAAPSHAPCRARMSSSPQSKSRFAASSASRSVHDTSLNRAMGLSLPIGLERPHALDGMDDQQVADLPPAAHQHVHAGEVVLHLRVRLPPGRLVEDGRGVVALGLAFHGVPRQVLAAQVDAQRRLPVAHGLVPGEGEVPARAAVGLRQPPSPAELPGGRADLLGRVVLAVVLGEQVHARGLHVLVEPQARADDVGLAGERLLAQHVAGEGQIMLAAPLADLPREGLDEQMRDAVEVVPPGLADGLSVHVEQTAPPGGRAGRTRIAGGIAAGASRSTGESWARGVCRRWARR